MINGYCQLDLTDLLQGLGMDEISAESLNETINEYKINLYERLKICLESGKPIIVIARKDNLTFNQWFTSNIYKGFDGTLGIMLAQFTSTYESCQIEVSKDNVVTSYQYFA